MEIQTFQKKMPESRAVEEAILGACLLERDASVMATSKLSPEDFYYLPHEQIFTAVKDLIEERSPVDLLTVMERMKKLETLTPAGGPAYLSELSNKVASGANVEYHCHLVKAMALKRGTVGVGNKLMTMGYFDGNNVEEIIEYTSTELYKITAGAQRKKSRSMADITKERLAQMDVLKNREEGLLGLSSGHKDVDAMFSGFQDTNLMILAARPGMGKTSLALTWARNMSVDQGVPGAYFSLEMSDLQLLDKMLAMDTGIPMHKIRDPKERDEDYNETYRIQRSAEKISNSPLYIDDQAGISSNELRAKAMELKVRHGIKYVIVDYIQLMSGSGKKQNREQEVSEISRNLKGLAKELNLPVIALSQLSRAVETRGGDKRPQLSDLRESGSLEQDADMVMFIYRPEYYEITENEEGESTEGLAILGVGKNRHGPLGDIWTFFEKRTTLFKDWVDEEIEELNMTISADARPDVNGDAIPF